MKSQVSCILFAALLATAACSGDRKAPTVITTTSVPQQVIDAPAVVPVIKVEPKAVEPVKPVAVEPPLPTKYSDAIAQGKELAAKGDHARARELFESAIKLDKKQAEPHIELARLFIATGDRGLAMAAANKGVKLAPGSSLAWNTLGRAELARFDYDGAVTAFTKATELSPDNVWAWNNLGFTQLAQKHYREAADALVEATSRKGATGYMWNNLGTAYEQLDLLDDARGAFDHGAELGSIEARASRKRLDGVKTIVVVKDATKSETVMHDEGAPVVEEPTAKAPAVEVIKPDDAKPVADTTKADEAKPKTDEVPQAPKADADKPDPKAEPVAPKADETKPTSVL